MIFSTSERRLLHAIMSAFTVTGGDFAVAEGEVDYLAAAETMASGGTKSALAGFHAAIWIVGMAPVWMLGRAQTFDELAPAARTELLGRMTAHRLYMIRGLTTLLKLATTLAMMRSPAVRARTRYDLTEGPYTPRRALPLVAQEG